MENSVRKLSTSKVILMCGPAGSGKSTYAKKFEEDGMIILSYDKESYKRGIFIHPLPEDVVNELKYYLDNKLISMIEQNRNIVLDYSFWSKAMRAEYITLLKEYRIDPIIYYIMTPKEIVMERIRKRSGANCNDIVLSEKTASMYYDNFQPPTTEECEVITIYGY